MATEQLNLRDIMDSIASMLSDSKELVEQGEGEAVGKMLTSFLYTLHEQITNVAMYQGNTGVRPTPSEQQSDQPRTISRRHRTASNPTRSETSKPKRPIPNKYEGKCKTCGIDVPTNEGFVLPVRDGNRKWSTYCTNHYSAAQGFT